ILTDVTRCIGCEECVDACALENGQRVNLLWRWSSKDGLSGDRFTSIVRTDAGSYVRKQCRHCLDPACVSACPVGALTKTDTGAVVYDADKCMGCRYCMMSCPFGIPRYTWQDSVPLIRKCTMCYESRLKEGREPACTSACPEEATIFGERDELIAEAGRRIAAEPDKYINRIYGEQDVGGTAVLYISHEDLDVLAWSKDVGTKPLPRLTAPAMNAVLPAFFTVGAGMGLIYWITKRRELVAESLENDKDRNVSENS
ncbi:4Fe-4S dicluster domain-containing protein, partial [candidate division KSB1 bacterium]